MNKGIIIRASIVLSIFIIIIGAAIGCEFYFSRDEVEVPLSNPSDAYLTLDGNIVITNQELWDSMKNIDGMTYLEEYVDRILLSDYIDDVDQDMIDNEILTLKYYTDDEDRIAEIQADDDLHQQYLDSFNENVIILGYDPEDPESLAEMVTLGIAKRNYATEQILDAAETDTYYVSESDAKSLFEEENRGTVCTIDLRFGNSNEALATFSHFNLRSGYTDGEGNTGIGLYDPSLNLDDESNPIAIGDVEDPNDFTDDNTTLLTDEEVFDYYVMMYNYINPDMPQIDESVEMANFCTEYEDIAVKVYDDMVEGRYSSDPLVSYATKIFVNWDLDDEDKKPYSIIFSGTYGEFMILTYKLAQDEMPDFDELSAAEVLELRTRLAEATASDSVIALLLQEQRQASGLTIYDPGFKLRLQFEADSSGVVPTYTLSTDGSKDYLATFNGGNVNADQLFEYMEARVGLTYAVELAKTEILLNSMYYTEFYGTEKDLSKSDNENVLALQQIMLDHQNSFLNNTYSMYGYDNAEIDWDDFLFLAFYGQTSINNVIRNVYMPQELSGLFTQDRILYNTAVDHMTSLTVDHVSLNVEHLLLFVDKDFDLSPDDFSDFYDGLTPEEVTEYDELVGRLTTEVNGYLSIDGNTFSTLVTEYKGADVGGESEWAEFKAYGLYIQTQSLGEINTSNIENYDEDFGAEVVRVYNLFTQADDIEIFMGERFIRSDFGVHMIEATEGTYFELPTAEFSYDDVDVEVGTYADSAESTSVIPTQAQVEDYLGFLSGEVAKDLPQSVKDAITYYYGEVYTAYTSTNGYQIMMLEEMLDMNITFANTDRLDLMEAQLEVFYNSNFPELFDKDAE